MRSVALLLIALLSAPALAQAPTADADAAERARLRESLQKLTDKGAWKGVDRTYGKLVPLEGLTVHDHLIAAQAALALGHTHQAQIRLQRAMAVDPGAPVQGDLLEVKRTLDLINQGYGRVKITVEPGRKPKLEAESMPFEARPRASIEHATSELASQRRFTGWIPVGRYTIDGTGFSVEAGGYWKEIAIAAH